jgi:hypothetical protein
MSEPRIQIGLEDNPKTFLDRVEIAGALVLQADITAVYAKVFQYDSRANALADVSGTQISTEIPYVTANVIFNALQTGGMWKKDATGYNFKAVVPASYFPTGGKFYAVEFRFDRSAGGEDDFYLPRWIIYAEPLAGS